MQTTLSDSPSTSMRVDDTPEADLWEFDDRLWDIAQVLRIGTADEHREENADPGEIMRFDPAHKITRPGGVIDRGAKSTKKDAVIDGIISAVVSLLVWSALSLGTAALACGGILLGWSLWTGRGELWNIGLPIALGGQISLLIGLAMQMGRVWRENNQTASKLDEVDGKIHDLKKTADLFSTIKGPSSRAFYTDSKLD